MTDLGEPVLAADTKIARPDKGGEKGGSGKNPPPPDKLPPKPPRK
jgi:hypothetical protein